MALENLPQDKRPNPGLNQLASRYMESLLQGDRRTASAMILEAVDRGTPVGSVYLDVFQPVQREVGRLWQTNAITVAVEHFCTAVTQMVMSQLFPRIITEKKNGLSMVGCCAGHELHELGIRMVCDFFEMESWDTYYMGANCPSAAVIETLASRNADVLCLSVTMQHNVSQAKTLIQEALKRFPQTKILAGGFPFLLNPDLARSIGAHGWARDAREGVDLAASWRRSKQV
ncbi:MAG: cobalamin-dependent protein [Desulfovibrionaceae bacterium]|nr:cobalamin-dependent protein [Desulfovibrionaceae bacterium]MBF0513677.1 cobalamin-dependent protein [Desulfovibrionaceae bacterium]